MKTQSPRRAMIAIASSCVLTWASVMPSWAQSGDLDAPIATAVQVATMTHSRKDMEILALRNRIEALEHRLNTMHAASLAASPGMAASLAGPSLAPSPPDLAERALERTLVRSGALLLPAGQIELEPSVSYSRAETTSAEVFAIASGGAALGAQKRVRNDRSLDMTIRAGLPFHAQAEIGISGVSAEQTFTSTVNGAAQTARVRETSAGDLRVGLAKSLLRERGALPDVIGRVTWDTDTGRTNDRLSAGSGFNEVEFGVTAIKRQDPLVFVGGIVARRAIEKNGVRPGNVYGGAANVSLAVSPETSLRMGVRYSRVEQASLNGVRVPGSDATPISLSLGAGSVVGRQRFIDVGVDIGLTQDAPQVVLALSVPLRGRLPRSLGRSVR